MFLVSPEEYASMKKKQTPSNVTPEATDVQLAKLQDAYVRKRDEKKIKENLEWDKLSSRLKPILASSHVEIHGIIDQFPLEMQDRARFILSTLSRLPKVLVTPNRLLIDGIPMEDSLMDIINDILQNNVSGVDTLIRALRNGRKDALAMKPGHESPRNKSESETPKKELGAQESSKTQAFSPVSNPKEVSPIKTRGQRARIDSPKLPTRSPVVSKLRYSPLPQKVSRSPTLSKVRRSPMTLKVQRSPKEEKKNDGAIGYWYNFD